MTIIIKKNMIIPLKKIIFSLIFNTSLFIVLIIGIQNSSKKTKVNFILNETIRLPIGFIVGSSFIGGSIAGSFLSFNLLNKKDKSS